MFALARLGRIAGLGLVAALVIAFAALAALFALAARAAIDGQIAYLAAAPGLPVVELNIFALFLFLRSFGEDFIDRNKWYWVGGFSKILWSIRGKSICHDIPDCRGSKKHLEHLLKSLMKFLQISGSVSFSRRRSFGWEVFSQSWAYWRDYRRPN